VADPWKQVAGEELNWRSQIVTGNQESISIVIDAAVLHSLPRAKRWTVAALTHWSALVPEGWWVAGRVAAGPIADVSGAAQIVAASGTSLAASRTPRPDERSAAGRRLGRLASISDAHGSSDPSNVS
jgi:hypothetical protein